MLPSSLSFQVPFLTIPAHPITAIFFFATSLATTWTNHRLYKSIGHSLQYNSISAKNFRNTVNLLVRGIRVFLRQILDFSELFTKTRLWAIITRYKEGISCRWSNWSGSSHGGWARCRDSFSKSRSQSRLYGAWAGSSLSTQTFSTIPRFCYEQQTLLSLFTKAWKQWCDFCFRLCIILFSARLPNPGAHSALNKCRTVLMTTERWSFQVMACSSWFIVDWRNCVTEVYDNLRDNAHRLGERREHADELQLSCCAKKFWTALSPLLSLSQTLWEKNWYLTKANFNWIQTSALRTCICCQGRKTPHSWALLVF